MMIEEVVVDWRYNECGALVINTEAEYRTEFAEFKKISGPFTNEGAAVLAFSLLIAIPLGSA